MKKPIALLVTGSLLVTPANANEGYFGDIGTMDPAPTSQPIDEPTLPIQSNESELSPLSEDLGRPSDVVPSSDRPIAADPTPDPRPVNESSQPLASPRVDRTPVVHSPVQPQPVVSRPAPDSIPRRASYQTTNRLGEKDFLQDVPNVNRGNDQSGFQVFQRPPGQTLALRYPLPSPVPVTSHYGWRTHPVSRKTSFHAGLDLGAPTGAPVLAAESGQVIRAGWFGNYGNTVDIDHGGVVTRYAHLQKIHVVVGMTIGKGAQVATVGSTGLSTGPHLHFEVRKNGQAVEPTQHLALATPNLKVVFNPAHLEFAFLGNVGTPPRT